MRIWSTLMVENLKVLIWQYCWSILTMIVYLFFAFESHKKTFNMSDIVVSTQSWLTLAKYSSPRYMFLRPVKNLIFLTSLMASNSFLKVEYDFLIFAYLCFYCLPRHPLHVKYAIQPKMLASYLVLAESNTSLASFLVSMSLSWLLPSLDLLDFFFLSTL